MKKQIDLLRAQGVLTPRGILCRLIGLYLLCTAAAVPLALTCAVLFIGTPALSVIRRSAGNPLSDSLTLLCGLFLFSGCALWGTNDAALCVGITLFFLLTASLFLRPADFQPLYAPLARIRLPLLILIPTAGFLLISVLCILRYRTYHASNFDLGIFIQMFHSMKTDFTQMTTCERNRPLSHFSVHISPIYYLLLPLYALIPTAETLLTAQAAVVISGVIPLLLLCRLKKFRNHTRPLWCILYCTSAALVSPCFYDFHENAFLPPLLLWFVYAMERGTYPLAVLSGILTLLVKEDAPIYLLCIGLYYLCTRQRRIAGLITALTALVYFLIALMLLSYGGEGAMIYRTYNGLMTDPEGGILNVILTVLRHPDRFLSICFRAEKLPFLLTMLLPLLFLPLRTKKPQRLFFCLPFVLTNLAPSYPYAADIGFQYVFGTFTCLLIAAVLNLSEVRLPRRRFLLPLMTAASVLCCICFDSAYLSYFRTYTQNHTLYAQIDALLETVPSNASVCADQFYLPHLAQRRDLYMLSGGQPEFYGCTYVVVDLAAAEASRTEQSLLANGYLCQSVIDGTVAVYKKQENIAQRQDTFKN